MVSLYFSDLAEGSTTPEPPPKGSTLTTTRLYGQHFSYGLIDFSWTVHGEQAAGNGTCDRRIVVSVKGFTTPLSRNIAKLTCHLNALRVAASTHLHWVNCVLKL